MKKSPLATILLIVFIDLIGFGMIIPILPLYAEGFGALEWQIGLLLASYSFMQFLASPVLGAISDRFGRKPVLLCSLLGSAISYILMANAHSLLVLFAARIIAGICGASVGTASAYIADITPPENRSRRIGLIGAAFGVGFVLGPAIGGLLSLLSVAAPFWFAALVALANALAVIAFLPEPKEHADRLQNLKSAGELWTGSFGRWLAFLVVTYFVAIVGFAIVTMIYPQVSNRRFGLSQSQISWIFVLLGLVGALIQGGAIGRLAKRFGDYKLAVAGLAVMAASMLLMPFGTSVPLFLLFTIGLGIGNSLAQPTINAMASKAAHAGLQGRVLGTLQSAGSLGRVCGPAIAGFLLTSDRIHPPIEYGNTPFLVGGLVMALAFAVSLALRRSEGAHAESSINVGRQSVRRE
ncbi:MAG TPA: MFS transporter [Chthoniobacterales bacterium]|nr:MFS transporter [Chthoniobacterales bacterium]